MEGESIQSSPLAAVGPLVSGHPYRPVESRPIVFWRRFSGQRAAVAGAVLLATMTLLALFAPLVAPFSWESQDVVNRWQTPSIEHLLGTDELGRDILSRIIWGARFSLAIGFGAVLISFTIGVLTGTISGFYRRIDTLVMRVVDIMLAFPSILLAIGIVAALGPGFINTMIVIGVTEIPGFVRLARSAVLSLREREYVVAARAMGANDWRIMARHILPNMVSPIVVFASLRVATALLTGATLSFLGLGVPPPGPEWGAMISTARNSLRSAPHTFVIPTVVLFLVVVSANMLGDGLRDTLDPQLRD